MTKIDQIFEDNKTFKSDRITLEPAVTEDFDIFQNLYTDEKVTRFLSISHLQNEEILLNQFNMCQEWMHKKTHYFVWTIFTKSQRMKIGRINIAGIDRKSKRCSLGYVLLPEYWRKGMMFEAVGMIMEYLFNELNFNKITASCNANNIPSSKLLEKSGFKLEGILRKHTFYKKLNKYFDVSYYGLLNPNNSHNY